MNSVCEYEPVSATVLRAVDRRDQLVDRDAAVAVAVEWPTAVEGRIAERGTHEELISHGGIYANLVRQFARGSAA